MGMLGKLPPPKPVYEDSESLEYESSSEESEIGSPASAAPPNAHRESDDSTSVENQTAVSQSSAETRGTHQPARPSAISSECTCSNDGRNLVLCIDGTGNQFSRKNSNVVELHSLLEKSEMQLTYYNSGIGTHVKHSTGWHSWVSLSAWKQTIAHATDMAIAWNFQANVLSAYQWLVENYQKGDRIFLFGFSRGAYQVRVIAGMLHVVGLLHKGNNEQIQFAYELYRNSTADDTRNIDANNSDKPLCDHFKRTFSRRDVRAHFVGAWDTVSSVGFLRGRILPETITGMKHVCAFRHALALDEKRVKFLPEYANGGGSPDGDHIKEVWFAGSHSDIGGGNIDNPANNRFGPSLRWMSHEAILCGLLMNHHEGEWELLPPVTDSMTWVWKPLEWIPYFMSRLSYESQDGIESWSPHYSSPRKILERQRIHQSVLEGIKQPKQSTNSDLFKDPQYINYQPSALLPDPHLRWDTMELLLSSDESGMIEKDSYMNVGDVLSQMTSNPQEPISAGDLIVLQTALSSGEVGRLAIISNPNARDNLITGLLKECKLDTGETCSQEAGFDTLIQALSFFDQKEHPSLVQKLLEVLKEFLVLNPSVGSKQHENFTKLKDIIIGHGTKRQNHPSIPRVSQQRDSNRRELFAVIVGINAYTNMHRSHSLSNLHGAVNDANAVTAFLIKDLGVAAENVITLCEEKATRDNIVKALTSLIDNPRIKRGDSILFYFAGSAPSNTSLDHHTPILYPYEPGPFSGAISDSIFSYKCLSDVIVELYLAYGDNITIVMDTTNPFPPLARKDRALPADVPNNDISRQPANEPKYLDRLNHIMDEAPDRCDRTEPFIRDITQYITRLEIDPSTSQSFGSHRTHMLLMACRNGEYSRESHGHGIFTTALLKVLENNKNLTYAQIIRQVQAEMSGSLQTPQLRGYHKKRRMFNFINLPKTVQ